MKEDPSNTQPDATAVDVCPSDQTPDQSPIRSSFAAIAYAASLHSL